MDENPSVRYAAPKLGSLDRCCRCHHIGSGFYARCDQPVSYVAEYRFLGGGGSDYPVRLCADHAAVARTHDSLKRIYTA